MVLLHAAVDSKKLDVRLVERNVTRGVLSTEDFEREVKALPDDSENAEYVNLDLLMLDPDETEMNGKAPHDH